MDTAAKRGRWLLWTRLLNLFFIDCVIVYVFVVYVVKSVLYLRVFNPGEPALFTAEAAIIMVAIISFAAAILLPIRMLKGRKHEARYVFKFYIYRNSTFISIALYGLILGILGSDWGIVLPLLAAGAAALLLTFPTEDRWNRITLPAYETRDNGR